MSKRREALTQAQRSALLTALAPFAHHLDRVDIFGSRARGDHRPGSDVDLLLHGFPDQAMLSHIREALEDSDLSIAVDVHFAGTLGDERLHSVAASESRPLFSRQDLQRAATGDAQ